MKSSKENIMENFQERKSRMKSSKENI